MEKRNVYKGHRYVPKIMGEWEQTETYEGLSIVTYQGTSYTSKKRVPVGIDILNEEYWVVTGNYNAQIEAYRKDVREVEKQTTEQIAESKKDIEQINNDLKSRGLNIEDFEEYVTHSNEFPDWTPALIKAIEVFTITRKYPYIYVPAGELHFYGGVQININGFKLVGAKGIRFNDEDQDHGIGTSLLVHYNGDFLRMGDNTLADYQGYHDGIFENLHIKYVGDNTSELLNPTARMYGTHRSLYGTGSRAIVDYNGGETLFFNCHIENFEVGLYGYLNDISESNRLKIFYCKTAIMCDNSPQTVWRDIYFIGNDTVLDIKNSTQQITFEQLRLVKNGHSNSIPIKINRFSNGVVFNECWLEDHNRLGMEMAAFVEIGSSSGDLVGEVKFNNTHLITSYTDYFIQVGRVRHLTIDGVFGTPKKRLINFVDGFERRVDIKVGLRKYVDGIYFDHTSGEKPVVFVEETDGNKKKFTGDIVFEKVKLAVYSSVNTELTANENTPIIFNEVIENYKSSYQISDGRFTAPKDGYYSFDVKLVLLGSMERVDAGFNFNGSNNIIHNVISTLINMPNYATLKGHVIIKMNQGDYVQLRVNSLNGGSIGNNNINTFMRIVEL